jgi:hypothetical protein
MARLVVAEPQRKLTQCCAMSTVAVSGTLMDGTRDAGEGLQIQQEHHAGADVSWARGGVEVELNGGPASWSGSPS